MIKGGMGAALLFVVAFFLRQPKIELQYKSAAGGTKAGPTSNILLWFLNADLVFYNLGPYDAFDLAVEIRPDRGLLRVNKIGQKHLYATDSFKVRLYIEQVLSKDRVMEARSNQSENELVPAEIRNLECRLSYKNGWGKRFYTKFRRTGAGDVVTYHRLKPWLRAS